MDILIQEIITFYPLTLFRCFLRCFCAQKKRDTLIYSSDLGIHVRSPDSRDSFFKSFLRAEWSE